MKLSQESKKNLLLLARKTLEEKILGKSSLEVDLNSTELNDIAGAFVSLHINSALRGCIGNIIGTMPLKETVHEMAIAAAFHDPRFPKLTAHELKQVEIEITVLSMPVESSTEAIEPYQHGVVLSRRGQKSTFLPQVWEQLPEKELFLSALCQKGGMEETCWKDSETKIETYTGLVFSEREL